MPWSDDLAHLTAAGYDESQISTYKQEQADKLRAGGFDEKAINSYFGLQEADMSLAKSMIEKNVAVYKPEEAHTFEDQVAAGFQISNIGQLLKFSKGESVQPTKVIGEDAGTKATVTAGLSQMAADIPSMAAGFMVGQEAGGVIGAGVGMLAAPVVGPLGPLGGFALGKTIGGAAGAFAAPTMIRSLLMNFYEKGQIKDARDFMSRLGSTFLETAKSGTVGVATEAIGGQVGATVAKAGAKTLVASTAKLAAEVGTMTTVSAALEGELPKYQDFINGAIMVGAFHGAVKTVDMSAATVTKMRKIYEATGTKPEQVVMDSQADPILKQELLSNSEEIPSVYKNQIDPKYEEIKTQMTELSTKPEPEVKAKVDEIPADVKSAIEHIQSRFGEKVEPKTDLKTAVTEFISEVPSKYIDRFSPVKDVSEGAYNKLRMLNASSGKAWNYIFDGARSFETGNKVGKSLEQITKEVGNREDNANFKAYLVAKRVVEDLSPRNIDQKIDVKEAKRTVDHFEQTTDFKRLAQEYTKYNDGLLQYGADAGLYSQKNIDAIKELSKNYVSFKKILDPESTTTKGKGSSKIYAIGNSDKLIQDPYLSAADKTATIIRLAERNRALTEFKDAAVAKGLVERVPAPKIEAKATVEELNAFLRKEGIEHEVDQTAALSLWRAGNIKDEPGQFSVMIDGKREVYKFTDDASKLLETSITTLTENPLIQNPVMEALRGLTQFKKGSITIAPIFKINNLFKDWTTFTVKTGEPAGPGEVLAAAMSIAKKDAQYIDFMQSGASNAGFINPETIANRLNQIGGLKKDKTGQYIVDNSLIGKTWNVISEAKEFNAVLSEVSDNTMRLIQYQRSLKSGMSKEQSAMAARDVTLDFDKRGQSAALANYTAITSFSRVAINGIENTIGTLKNNPQAFANGVKYITIPSVLLWAANKTDKRMDDIPEWEKLVFWHIPTHKWVPVTEDNMLKFNGIVQSEHFQHLVRQTSDGKYEMDEGIIFRIPKNELFGTMFGTLPQLALDQVYDRLIGEGKPQEAKKMVDNVLGLVKPNMMPDFAVPLVEQFANKNFFTGQKIVPATLEQASPEHQYNEYTTDAARAAGAIIGYLPFIGKNGLDDKTVSSPMIVENYVRSWAGNNGMYALQALSKLIPDSVYQSKEYKSAIEKPSSTVYDIPEIKRLVTRYPQLNSQPITDFEALYEKYQQSIADYRQANKELNIESAVGIKAEALRKYGEIQAMHGAMQSAHTAVKMIKLSDMTGDQKEQMIEAAYFQMNEIAKKGLEAARQNEDLIKQLGEGN